MDYVILYLAVLAVGLEMALMVVGYLAHPRAFANRIFALFMLALVLSAVGVILQVTAPFFAVAAAGIWLHAAAIIAATTLLALLLLALFVPHSRYRRPLSWLAIGVGVGAFLLLVIDIFVSFDLVYQFDEAAYVSGYLSLATYLMGMFGPLIYGLVVQSTHVLFPILILVALLTNEAPPRQRAAGWGLLALLVVAGVINGFVLWQMPALVGLTGSLSVAVMATWGIVRYRILSPTEIGEKQALDTAVFGIILFDDQGKLLEWNQTARRLLLLEGNKTTYTLCTMLAQVAEMAVNRDGVMAFIQETAIPFTANRELGLILPASQLPGESIWLLLQFTIIYAENKPIGLLCTVEDQTAVRTSQNQLEQAHRSLEKFAYHTTLLNDITQTGISDLNINDMLQRFADRLGDLFAPIGCYITLWDAARQQVLPGAAYGPMRQVYPTIPILYDHPTVTEAVLQTGRYLVVPDLAHSDYNHFYQVSAFAGKSMLAVPLIASSQKLGAILIVFDEIRTITATEINLGEQAANQIALAIAKMRLLDLERAQRELAETLNEIGTALTGTLDYEALLDITLVQIRRVVPYDTANIALLEQGEIRVSRAMGYEAFTSAAPAQLADRPFTLATIPTFQQIVETRQPLCLPDTRQYGGWVVTPATRHVRSWIGVPLLMSDEVIGFLCVDKTQPGFYDDGHKERLAAVANQVALALQQAQLFAESQRQAQRLSILNDLASQMVSLVTVKELTDLVAERLYEDFDYDNVVIFMMAPDNAQELFLQSVAGIYSFMTDGRNHRQAVGQGIIGQAAARGEYVLANDTAAHPDFFQPPGFNVRAELAMPIKIDQTVLGVLNIDSRHPHIFDYADISLLAIVADQLAATIQKARLFELTHKRAQELETLSVVSARLRAAHTVADMLPIVLENIVQAVNATVGVIYLKDESGEQVISRAVYPAGSYTLGLTHRLGQGITGHVAQSGEMYFSPHLQDDPHLFRHESEMEHLQKLHTSIALPLQTEEVTIGVVHIGFSYEYQLSDAEEQLLTSLTDIAANALYRAQVMESLEERVEERTQALRKANIRLQELDRLKSKFISDVTHELRTPVANLNLYLDLLRIGKPEKKQHYMNVIETQTARLTQIVETTMRAPEVDMMTPPDQFVAVALNDVTRTAVSAQIAQIARTQKSMPEIKLETPPHLPPIMGDAAQLGQVVQELLANAVSYSTQGPIIVSLSYQTDQQMVCLQVVDHGMGIEEEDMPYIFDRFYRGRQVGQLTIPGVGMGLFIAREIVEWHNGRITIQSTPGQGTTCTVLLPAVREQNV